ncbi:enoyl-CoA hydratase-related protein [Orrella sp. JC864]|uniref:enoyl-CoA hydratase-related protein n=1 Tax=Orrella sp. JC864 TaxID=3120298 RepID=UPI0012BD73D7
MSIERTAEAGILTITINRPEKMNALDPASMVALRDALKGFDADPSLQVAILTGAGERAFCAGADLTRTLPDRPYVSGMFEREADARSPLYIRNISLPRLGLSKPLIAAVNGVAVGGGMELALNADYCLCASGARFGLTEPRVGSIPAISGIQRLMQSLPRSAAMRLLLTGEIIDAATAHAYGVVTEVVAAGELLPRAREIAGQIVANAPLAVRAIKYLADKAMDLPVREALEVEELVWGHLLASEDRIEGRKAFAEKRKPSFRGC